MAIHVDAVRFAGHSEIYEEAATREPVIIYRDGIPRHVLVSLDVVEALRARQPEREKLLSPMWRADRLSEER